jgi:hypothetical protein
MRQDHACPTCGRSDRRAAITNPGAVRRTPSGLVLDGWGFGGEQMSVGGWTVTELAQIAADLGTLEA